MQGEGHVAPRRRALAVAAAILAPALAGVPACTDAAEEEEVAPIGPTADDREPADAPAPEPPPGRVAPGAADPAGAEPSTQAEALHHEVAELLARYDEAFAALAADPLASGEDTHPTLRAWAAAVSPGSSLDLDVREQLRVDARDNRVAYRPSPQAILRSDHVVAAATEPDGSVSWTNCAFTPWLEVDLDTGAVLDDRPFRRRGSGRAVREPDGSLLLVELVDEELEELATGAADPCDPDPTAPAEGSAPSGETG